jgi:hypothetical protein
VAELEQVGVGLVLKASSEGLVGEQKEAGFAALVRRVPAATPRGEGEEDRRQQ